MPTAPDLLIAVTGSPEDCTRALAALATELSSRGQSVGGLLAVGSEDKRDAGLHRVQLLGEPSDDTIREREVAPSPGRVDAHSRGRLSAWAGGLSARPRLDLLLLDAGDGDAAGEDGHLSLWPDLVAAAPRIAVVAVRTDEIERAQQRLGRRFDLCLAAADPATLGRLRAACLEFREWTHLGLWGGAAGSVELTLGSALHAMKIPLRGAALCSIQAAVLTFASASLAQPGRVAWVAFISSGLKAFSPGGGRVRPMVAIAVQGALFGAIVQLFGWHIFSVALGAVAVGAWAALQGFLLQYLLLGDELVAAYARVVRWLAENWQVHAPSMPVLLVAWSALHALAAAGAAVAAWRIGRPPRALQHLVATPAAPTASPLACGNQTASLARRVAREFARWPFWVPLVLVGVVLLLSGRPWEDIFWLIVRFVAVGAVLFAVLSLFRPAVVVGSLRRRGWWGPAAAFAEALTCHRPR